MTSRQLTGSADTGYAENFHFTSVNHLCAISTVAGSMLPKRLLLTTDLSVHEVGSQVGIENTNHFINLFKKDTGTTPLSFKQAAPVSISDLHYN